MFFYCNLHPAQLTYASGNRQEHQNKFREIAHSFEGLRV